MLTLTFIELQVMDQQWKYKTKGAVRWVGVQWNGQSGGMLTFLELEKWKILFYASHRTAEPPLRPETTKAQKDEPSIQHPL